MAKRQIVDVDEEYLREVMAGGSVRSGKKEPVKEPEQQALPVQTDLPVKEEKEDVIQPIETIEAKETVRQIKKKREIMAYETLFLQRKASVPRRQTYICSSYYDKINSFLPVIARGLSITAYLDNILTHHLEQYRDDINEIYERKSQKPL